MSALASAAIADNPWLAASVRIADVVTEFAGVATYYLQFDEPARATSYGYAPGQFNMLYVPGVGEIAISISGGLASREGLAHTVRVAGNVTQSLARLGKGDSLALRGPYGSAWPLDETRDADIVLVAGGIGLAPLRAVVEARLDGPSPRASTTLLYGARSPDVLLYDREFAGWTGRGLHLQCTVDRPHRLWVGHVGAVPLLVDRLSGIAPANCALFLCGPEVMMRYSVRSALARGVRKEQIWVSLERNMQCAVGLCGHCQLGPAFVCQDGPVFRYDKIEPYLDVEDL
ncbi:MAG: FAD/NAD(P)-binding protein [Pirellulales bacterium]|nr:FAD/NAD(P)-binding protein [Pirellulales bacterium]